MPRHDRTYSAECHPSTPATTEGSLLSRLEIDVRMLGMLGALAVIWIGFDILSGGVFLTPRNLWNLSVQTASIAIMSTGMVLVIVTRNIDLSVGAILGVVGMIIGVAAGAVAAGAPWLRALAHGARSRSSSRF